MAAYKKGTQLPEAGFNKDAYLKRQASEIEGNMAKLGFSNKTTTPEGMTKYTKPQGSFPTIGGSYNKMIGGGGAGGSMYSGGGFGGGLPSMGSLEAASMRLANAASRRNIAEKQAERESEIELQAKQSGYSSLDEMQRDIRSKRLEQEAKMKKQKEEEDMTRRGYVKSGGRWVMPVR